MKVHRRALKWLLFKIINRFFPNSVFWGDGFIVQVRDVPESTDKVNLGVVGFLINQVALTKATSYQMDVNDVAIAGEPFGKWRIRVERTDYSS